MRTLLNLESGEVRVRTPDADECTYTQPTFWVVRGRNMVVKIFTAYAPAAEYAVNFVNYLRRTEDADLEI